MDPVTGQVPQDSSDISRNLYAPWHPLCLLDQGNLAGSIVRTWGLTLTSSPPQRRLQLSLLWLVRTLAHPHLRIEAGRRTGIRGQQLCDI